jgi:hypothetical protein
MPASAAASRRTAEATNQRPWIPTKLTPHLFSSTTPARIVRQTDAADRHPVGGISATGKLISNPARAILVQPIGRARGLLDERGELRLYPG